VRREKQETSFMSVGVHRVPPAQSVDGTKYWSVLLAIAGGHGLAILLAADGAGLTLAMVATSNPVFVIAQMLLVAVLLCPAVWLTIRRFYDRKTPGWLSLPTILLAALALMTTAFGRPFSVPVALPMLQLLPLSLIVLVLAFVIVEWLGIGRRETMDTKDTAPVETELRLAA
jgi:uncharacterized membrane protein YhaH (DUF805 family)